MTEKVLDFLTGFDVVETPLNHFSIALDLSEIAAGGELAGTLDAPTVDAVHSGSAHHASYLPADHAAVGDSSPHHASYLSADHAALGDSSPHHAAVTIGADGQHSLATQVLSGVAAGLTQAGHVELATAAETTTGTDATRAVTPDGLAGSNYGKRVVGILVSDPGGDAITTGDGKAYFRVPSVMNTWNLVAVAASLSTVSSSGILTVQIRRSRWASATTRTAVDMLSTKLTVDASEFDSIDAANAAVINASNDDVNTGDHIYIDIDVAGTGAKGLFCELIYQAP